MNHIWCSFWGLSWYGHTTITTAGIIACLSHYSFHPRGTVIRSRTFCGQYLGYVFPISSIGVERFPNRIMVCSLTELRHLAGDTTMWKIHRLRTITHNIEKTQFRFLPHFRGTCNYPTGGIHRSGPTDGKVAHAIRKNSLVWTSSFILCSCVLIVRNALANAGLLWIPVAHEPLFEDLFKITTCTMHKCIW